MVPASCPAVTDFVCQSGDCIESHLVCDSKADCADESDEVDCGYIVGLPGACNFDMPKDMWEETCQLTQDPDDDFDWRIGQRRDTPGTGPPFDHSPGGEGKFLYVHSATEREGDIAKVTTRNPFPASIGLCHLRFWFYMHGSDRMGTLKVYTVGSSGTRLLMWAASGNHGDRWSYASVILSNTTPFRVTFQAEVGGDVWTDIALDDISFTTQCVVGEVAGSPFTLILTLSRCQDGWTGNRCHVRPKPSPSSSISTALPEDPGLETVYAGIAIGLTLLILGIAVCVLFVFLKRHSLNKRDLKDFEAMDNPAFDWRAELPGLGTCPRLNPKTREGPGLPISVYPWRRDAEWEVGFHLLLTCLPTVSLSLCQIVMLCVCSAGSSPERCQTVLPKPSVPVPLHCQWG
ncbi:unnamed protein product [Oncorhynchus mykiss]|uniref:MAM domain-containing protein n=1 Tax=Oncorhynchus mykiss TaxID=8022 RepID=A0A060VSV7_ONCMY|nr:unnamed protein product [Oncorhynchus mykiss]